MKKIILVIILTIIILSLITVVLKPAIFRSLYLITVRKIVQIQCRGPNKTFTTLGFFGSPFCANVFNDGGKSCDSGSECLSGLCYLDYNKRRELAEKQFGREAFYRGNSDQSLTIPPKSGICKQNDIPSCFSLGGSVKLENRKVAEVFPTCD